MLAKSVRGEPALTVNSYGKGRAYLLGFCLQDADFFTWASDDAASLSQLQQLLYAIANDAKVKANVRSINPDVEAAVRANEKEAFLFVISHEAKDGKAAIELRELPFKVNHMTDVATDKSVEFSREGNAIKLNVDALTVTTELMKLNGITIARDTRGSSAAR